MFCQVFVTFLYHMQCTVSNLNKLYLLKIRTCIEILASNPPLPHKKRCFKCKINLKLMPISFAVVVQQENWYLFSRGRPWHWSRYWRTADQQRNIQTANLNMWCTSLHMLKNLWRILEASQNFEDPVRYFIKIFAKILDRILEGPHEIFQNLEGSLRVVVLWKLITKG